ncbi:MAG: hypothetical protein AB7V32_09400 [Candidatus Berkiella sp.]
MKNLNLIDCQQISGGTQYLSITSRVEFEGISQACIADFYHNNTDGFANVTIDNLDSMIINGCAELANTSYSVSMDVIPVSILVVDL